MDEIRIDSAVEFIKEDELKELFSFLLRNLSSEEEKEREWNEISKRLQTEKNFETEHFKVRKYERNSFFIGFKLTVLEKEKVRQKFTTLLESRWVEALKHESEQKGLSSADILNIMLEERYGAK